MQSSNSGLTKAELVNVLGAHGQIPRNPRPVAVPLMRSAQANLFGRKPVRTPALLTPRRAPARPRMPSPITQLAPPSVLAPTRTPALLTPKKTPRRPRARPLNESSSPPIQRVPSPPLNPRRPPLKAFASALDPSDWTSNQRAPLPRTPPSRNFRRPLRSEAYPLEEDRRLKIYAILLEQAEANNRPAPKLVEFDREMDRRERALLLRRKARNYNRFRFAIPNTTPYPWRRRRS